MTEYCTVAEVRALAEDDTLSEAGLTALIPAVSRGIDRHCRRRFYQTTACLLHDLDVQRPDTVRLKDDLLALTSLTSTAGNTFTSSDFLFEPDQAPYSRLRLKPNRLLSYQDTPRQALSVVGVWGYSTVVPSEVGLVAKLWTLFLYRQLDLVGVDAARIAGVSLQLPKLADKLPPDLAGWLKPFVRHTIRGA